MPMDKMIDDGFFYAYMPQVEKVMLEKIPLESELSHQFSWRFKRKMKALLKYERRTPVMRRFVYQMKTAAAVLLIVLSMAFGTVMSVEAYRVRFFEFVTEIWEELTSIVIHSDENADHDTLTPISPSYIPKGYSVLELTSDKYENTIIYINTNGLELYYSQRMATQSEFILDSEGAETEKITIGSQEAYLIANKGTVQLYWHDDDSVFSLIGNLDKTELIKMAKSIIK
jgi:hypothetical protein